MNEHSLSYEDHFVALRRTLIQVFATIGIGFGLLLTFHSPLIRFMESSLTEQSLKRGTLDFHQIQYTSVENSREIAQIYTLQPGENAQFSLSYNIIPLNDQNIQVSPQGKLILERHAPTQQFLILSPIEGMMVVLKLCVWGSLIGTSPIWMLWLSFFILPGLKDSERGLIFPVFGVLFTSFLMGGCFGGCAVLPLANQYLFAFNQSLGVNTWSLSSYLDYTLLLILGNGCAFSLIGLMLVLIHFQFLTSFWLKEKRRYAITLNFILAAILTPPDIFTQILLAVPMCLGYEAAILYARYLEKRACSLICDVRR